MHANQLSVTVETVRGLVGEQFTTWASQPISPVRSEGTVNAIFRIGDHLAARFPLQPGDIEATRESLQREADAARELVGRTRVPVPEPVAIGEPGAGYPLPWSVQTWLPGVLDVGGLGPADRALDLVGGWHLLDAGPRELLRAGLRCDELEWERGKAWAFEQSMGAVWYYAESNPSMSRMGQRPIERVLHAEA